MIDKGIVPQVMCDACGHIFPTPSLASQDLTIENTNSTISPTDEITCPECKTHAKPKGIMQPSGFPSLETFKRNWKRSKSIDILAKETLANSSEANKD